MNYKVQYDHVSSIAATVRIDCLAGKVTMGYDVGLEASCPARGSPGRGRGTG
jgi:hypothetical protein